MSFNRTLVPNTTPANTMTEDVAFTFQRVASRSEQDCSAQRGAVANKDRNTFPLYDDWASQDDLQLLTPPDNMTPLATPGGMVAVNPSLAVPRCADHTRRTDNA